MINHRCHVWVRIAKKKKKMLSLSTSCGEKAFTCNFMTAYDCMAELKEQTGKPPWIYLMSTWQKRSVEGKQVKKTEKRAEWNKWWRCGRKCKICNYKHFRGSKVHECVMLFFFFCLNIYIPQSNRRVSGFDEVRLTVGRCSFQPPPG